ncbi:M23 family metallopeptidase [Corynebacterium fournieri]|uniref:M23 family metallopeptidase n=1 Tax=Corynebacterium fournieri TaxID=1852390 RepID=UPI000A2EE5A0|nr:M23 family metallopeptidase [Corynebacterium fournieri]WJY97832.1 Peptidase family M23 [Corynebacterium fournieri]
MRLSTILRPTTALFSLPLFFTLLAAAPAAAWVDPAAGTPYPAAVARPADIPEQNWKPGHRGVDLPLRVGEPVLASGDGVVAFAGAVAGTPVLSIDHPGGIRTTYQPVRTTFKVGEQVREGQEVGTLVHAPAGFAGSHDGLHWGALTGKDSYIDPLTLLESPRIRLKPLDGATTRGDAPGRRRA